MVDELGCAMWTASGDQVMGKHRIAILGIGVVCSTFMLERFSADPRPKRPI
jgi:hypothetical protein